MSEDVKRILLVEDEQIVALDLSGFLSDLGYAVVTAHDVSSALRVAAEKSVDLAILDIALGGGADGIELAMLLKLRTGMPVIYLTGRTDPWLRERAELTEPVGFLHKPYHPELLKSLVDQALRPISVDVA